MKNRIIAFIMAIAIVFSFASCDFLRKQDEPKTDDIPPKNDDFTVETETVEYDDTDVEKVSDRVEALVSDLADILGYGQHFDEDRRAELHDTVVVKVIPVLIDVGVYPEEFYSLLDCLDKGTALYRSESNDETKPKEISDLYTDFISVIDIDRLGALIYELIMIRLDGLFEVALEKYESKNNKLNLDNLEYYRALVERADNLGRDKFTDAFSIITFSASLLNSTADIDSSGISLSVDDAFAILEKQGERLAKMTLTESDWQAVASVVEEFLPDSGSSIKEKLLLSLNYADFFIESADVMPDIVGFYAELMTNVSDESIELIKNGGQYSYELFLTRELICDEASLIELLNSIEAKIPTADSGTISAIKRYDKVGYLSFCENYSATRDELLTAIKSFSSSADAESYAVLREAYFGYLASINSVVAYVYIYS